MSYTHSLLTLELPSRNARDPKHYRRQPPTARGYFLSPETAGEAMPMNDTAHGRLGSHSLSKPLIAKLCKPRYLFSLPSPHPPHTYSTQSNPSAALSSEGMENFSWAMQSVIWQSAVFDKTLKACTEPCSEVPTSHKGNFLCFNFALHFQLPVLQLNNLKYCCTTETPALQCMRDALQWGPSTWLTPSFPYC